MEYLSKTMRLDTEVIAWLDKLKSDWGSYNKGLRLIAFTEESRGKPPIDVAVIVPQEQCAVLDAVGSELSSGRGKASTEHWNGPPLKPKER